MTYAQKKQIIKAMQSLVPPHSIAPSCPEVLEKLTALTTDLIRAYRAEGKLKEHPFAEAAARRIHLYSDLIATRLQGKTVLVTGGEGCVGKSMLEPLLILGAKRVISVDRSRLPHGEVVEENEKLVYYPADIRDRASVAEIFDREQPEIVFHLAAQRSPSLAEIEIRDTITSNIIGTQNIIDLCETYAVEQCIFSSTGKASRYYTADVYAASKKLCEWLFSKAALKGKTVYAAVRFTHILDNSLIETKIEYGIEKGLVDLHKPDIDLLPQNVSEANHLLLNGLVEAIPGKLKILIVRDLGWPIDLLELPLLKILQSGKKIPLYFNGLKAGYDEPFFHGQFDPSLGTEVNPLINALEDPSRTYDRSGTMTIVEMPEFDPCELDRQVTALIQLAMDKKVPQTQLKALQAQSVRAVATSLARKVQPERLLRVLHCGINADFLRCQGVEIEAHRDVLGIILDGMYGRLDRVNNWMSKDYTGLDLVIDSISSLPELATQTEYLKSAYRKAQQQAKISDSRTHTLVATSEVAR
jgi:NADP-dependent 3-hydroxy acid dehydrogenase YdfG